jgi:hypothetical protein
MGRVGNTCGREDKCVQGFGKKARRKETTRKDNIKMYLRKIVLGGVD